MAPQNDSKAVEVEGHDPVLFEDDSDEEDVQGEERDDDESTERRAQEEGQRGGKRLHGMLDSRKVSSRGAGVGRWCEVT